MSGEAGARPTGPWRAAERHPPLGDDEVHVWRASLDVPPTRAAALAALLDDAERARAARFHAEAHRRRFVVARATLRTLLARYLGAAPGDLAFGYGPHGKPALAAPGGHALRFNLSHCDDVALYAFARARELGVDVERPRASLDAEGVAARFFAAREVAELRALPAAERAAAFAAGWARKEAYLKGLGSGLARPLGDFSVSLAPGDPVRLADAEGGGQWSLRSLDPGDGLVGALAVERGGEVRVALFGWDERG
jgi:4'-phosphopantetheinyl transferase